MIILPDLSCGIRQAGIMHSGIGPIEHKRNFPLSRDFKLLIYRNDWPTIGPQTAGIVGTLQERLNG